MIAIVSEMSQSPKRKWRGRVLKQKKGGRVRVNTHKGSGSCGIPELTSGSAATHE